MGQLMVLVQLRHWCVYQCDHYLFHFVIHYDYGDDLVLGYHFGLDVSDPTGKFNGKKIV